MLKPKELAKWGVLVVSIMVCDQLSKWLVTKHLLLHEPKAIMPGLNFMLAYNQGAAFGFLAESSGWQRWLFVGLAVVISLGVFFWLKSLTSKDKLESFALVCILGGALGNLIDRVRLGVVIDFIDVYVKDWHWYTFNLADSAICVGAVLLMCVSCFKK